MTERELRKLNRTDLLELMLQQSQELEHLRAELDKANKQLANREILIGQAGSIAEASLQLNGVFAAAESACAQYMENIKNLSSRQEALCAQMEQKTKLKCEKMLSDAQYQVDLYWRAVNEKVEKLLDSQKGLRDLIHSHPGTTENSVEL